MHSLHFKHLFGADPHAWGAIGFPSSQSPTNALQSYRRGDPVLLAVTKHPDPVVDESRWRGLEGKIFGVCTLLHIDVATEEYANQELARRFPELARRWRRATPIDEMWLFDEPASYDVFGSGQLLRLCRSHQGKLIHLARYPKLENELQDWLSSQRKRPVEIYRSPRALEIIRLRTSGKPEQPAAQ